MVNRNASWERNAGTGNIYEHEEKMPDVRHSTEKPSPLIAAKGFVSNNIITVSLDKSRPVVNNSSVVLNRRREVLLVAKLGRRSSTLTLTLLLTPTLHCSIVFEGTGLAHGRWWRTERVTYQTGCWHNSGIYSAPYCVG